MHMCTVFVIFILRSYWSHKLIRLHISLCFALFFCILYLYWIILKKTWNLIRMVRWRMSVDWRHPARSPRLISICRNNNQKASRNMIKTSPQHVVCQVQRAPVARCVFIVMCPAWGPFKTNVGEASYERHKK